MLCQDCNKNEAIIHLTQIVNNEKVVLNLCKDCAGKRGFHSPFEQVPFPLAEIVSGMVGSIKPQKKDKADKDVRSDLFCPNCGLNLNQFPCLKRKIYLLDGRVNKDEFVNEKKNAVKTGLQKHSGR